MVLDMALSRPSLNPSSAMPLYRQIAAHIEASITAGDLRPGDKLPAERDLAEDWQVAYFTIRRAMEALRQRGLIETAQGKGTFVKASEGDH